MNLKQYMDRHIRKDPATGKRREHADYLHARQEFVKALGVSSAYLCQLVNGKSGSSRKVQPSPELAQRIHKATDGHVELWALLPKVYPKPAKV